MPSSPPPTPPRSELADELMNNLCLIMALDSRPHLQAIAACAVCSIGVSCTSPLLSAMGFEELHDGRGCEVA